MNLGPVLVLWLLSQGRCPPMLLLAALAALAKQSDQPPAPAALGPTMAPEALP